GEGAGGVDAVGGDLGVDAVEVGGREAEPGAPAGAPDDCSPDAVGSAQDPGGLFDKPLGQALADARGGNDLAIDLGGRGHLEVEAGLGAPGGEDLRVAADRKSV